MIVQVLSPGHSLVIALFCGYPDSIQFSCHIKGSIVQSDSIDAIKFYLILDKAGVPRLRTFCVRTVGNVLFDDLNYMGASGDVALNNLPCNSLIWGTRHSALTYWLIFRARVCFRGWDSIRGLMTSLSHQLF
jgi:hypothetical protein